MWKKQWTKGNGGRILKGRRGRQDCGLALLAPATRERSSTEAWRAAGLSRGDPLSPLPGV